MSDPYDDADYATRAYMQELDEVRAGRARDSGSVLVSIRAGRGSQHYAVLYAADADDGDRAVVVVPLGADSALQSIADATAATFYGTLRPGHAVAVAVGEDLHLPAGPSFRPGPLVPRCRATDKPSWLATLPGYLGDQRWWRVRGFILMVAIFAGLYAPANQSLVALAVFAVAITWFGLMYRRWRSTEDPFDDG